MSDLKKKYSSLAKEIFYREINQEKVAYFELQKKFVNNAQLNNTLK
jgi:hypothetical protein